MACGHRVMGYSQRLGHEVALLLARILGSVVTTCLLNQESIT